MKKCSLLALGLFLLMTVHGQATDTAANHQLKEAVLKEIAVSFANRSRRVDSTIRVSNQKIDSLNRLLNDLKSTNEKVTLLQQRIKAIEDKQNAIELGELNTYQANYQSALVNLVSLQKEIQPLLLLNKTKNFFTGLQDMANPVNYAGYQDWFNNFKTYMEKAKKKDAMLQVTSNLLNASGSLTAAIPLTGALSQVFFQGLSTYVNSIPKRKKGLRDKSEKMFALTVKLAQFASERNLIELEASSIGVDLKTLESSYEKLRKENFAVVGLDEVSYQQQYLDESDAFKVLDYLNRISLQAGAYVTELKVRQPKSWKDKLYYEMMDIQALKMQFGGKVSIIRDNINKYALLLDRYKTDADLKSRIQNLASLLKQVDETFDKTYPVSDYLMASSRMYRAN